VLGRALLEPALAALRSTPAVSPPLDRCGWVR